MAPSENSGIDFVVYLQFDIIMRIMSLLNDPLDVVRASAVSRAWHHFVINNSLLKNLCIKNAPAISTFDSIIVQEDGALTVIDYRSEHPLSFEVLKKDHIMYSYLLQALSRSSIAPKDILECVLGASSTQSYPEESIVNVLLPCRRFLWGDSYWSSRGCRVSNVPEKILFKLCGDVSIVTDIQIRPAQRLDHHVYSAISVRFRMGHSKSYRDLRPNIVQSLPLGEIDENNYVWSYTSPVFPMLEEASLQTFSLPEPVLCIGGYLEVELLDKAQKDSVNGLYYTCLGHVRIWGHSLMPAFDVQMGESGSISLKYRPDAAEYALDYLLYDGDESDDEGIPDLSASQDRPMLLVQIENLIKLRMFP
ncbi:hypothetical protein CDL12_11126 [Handroanthus impetiginosus]|uniref:F-box domain-containing protein n=1 Tax=Handroanthus impetiginosus TaxID=429701 RepID=A0A2G9HFD8_9LAMI|nr:hypothetical protein CDL12_11126 [Handroanthus impetiginosus]